LVIVLYLATGSARIINAQDPTDPTAAEVLSIENSVDASIAPPDWRPATLRQKLLPHNWLRTGEDSRAAVRVSDSSIIRFDELTESEILPPKEVSEKPTLNLKQGTTYFFSREKSRELHVQTPAANGTIRGTEFVATVAANGNTSFTMLAGEVELTNAQGSVVVQSSERADVGPAGKPRKVAIIGAINAIQWCLYYPGILDLEDLKFSQDEQDALSASLLAYRTGDLPGALKEYPVQRTPTAPAEKVYRASLLLVVGQTQKAERLLRGVNQDAPGRAALSTLVAAITLKQTAQKPKTASDFIAESYYRQSRGDLAGARRAAERATDLDPKFGFGWTRVAEAEFALGRVSQAKESLEKGLAFSPRNPAAHALRGSLLFAEDKIEEAKDSFEKALAINSALGDAWLGHGLCLLRLGQGEAGWRDLQTAAALEPNRAIFRRYLGEDVIGGGKQTTQKKQTARAETTPSPQPGHSPKAYRGQVVQDPGPYYPQPIYPQLPYPPLPPRSTRPGNPKGTESTGQPERGQPSRGNGSETGEPSSKGSTKKPTKGSPKTSDYPRPSPRPTRPERPKQTQQGGQPGRGQPSSGAETQTGQPPNRSKKKKPTEAPSPVP